MTRSNLINSKAMKNLQKIIMMTIISGLSTSVYAMYIPDLFGAYGRGAEQARQSNAHYAQYASPTFVMGAYSGRTGKLKMTTRVSVKNKDLFCWRLYNIPSNNDYYVIEQFTQPKDGDFHGLTNNEIVKYEKLSFNSVALYRKTNSNNSDEVIRCYSFGENAIRGKYHLTVTIGNHQFNTQSFTVVN